MVEYRDLNKDKVDDWLHRMGIKSDFRARFKNYTWDDQSKMAGAIYGLYLADIEMMKIHEGIISPDTGIGHDEFIKKYLS